MEPSIGNLMTLIAMIFGLAIILGFGWTLGAMLARKLFS